MNIYSAASVVKCINFINKKFKLKKIAVSLSSVFSLTSLAIILLFFFFLIFFFYISQQFRIILFDFIIL